MLRRPGIPALLIAVLLIGISAPAWADVESKTGLSSVGSQSKETELGDLVADAVKSACDTPIALVPAGCLREVKVPKGAVSPPDVISCLQYPGDNLAVIEVTGDQLLRALERSISLYPQKNLGFVQVSGLKFDFDPKASRGSRVGRVIVGKEDLQSARKYRLATTEPLAGGAYGYFTVWGKGRPDVRKGKDISGAAKDFLAQQSTVDYDVPDRIVAK